MLRRENDTLLARSSSMSSQIADLTLKNAIVLTQNIDLSSRVAALSAQNAVLSSQMATVLARLDTLAASERKHGFQQYDVRTSFTDPARSAAIPA